MLNLKNYTNNLQYSQRFENNNFAYYNDYQTKAEYQGDLTKMFYNCSRKAPPLFVMNNPVKYQQFRDKKLRMVKIDEENQQQIDQFLHTFYEIYNQNNFSDMKEDLEQFKYKHNVRYFPDDIEYLKKLNINNFKSKCELTTKSFLDFKNYMTDQSSKYKDLLTGINTECIPPQKILFYQRWFQFQEIISEKLSLIDQYMKANADKLIQKHDLFLFKWITQQLLDQMTSAQVWPVLLLNIPNVPQLKGLINPLSIALQGFMLKEISITKSSNEQRIQTPKLMFINLDGRETPFNIRTIKSIKQSVYYITIFKEPDMSNETQEQVSSNKVYSKLLINELSFEEKQFNLSQKHMQLKQEAADKYFKILAFPLNSQYLKQEYQRHNNNKPFVEFGSSEDILFLFQHAIYNQIRQYVPNTIIVSYNGLLNIQQQHFNQIIRNLTIIGDHRVLLFPNLSQMFINQTVDSAMQQQTQQSDDLLFLKKYMPYNLQDINQQRFFNNLAMFCKITSGAYSLQQRNILPEYSKFNMPRKYQYFQKLYSLRYFKHYQKFVMKFWKSDQLRQLLKKQRDVLLQINQNQNQQYSKLIDLASECIGNGLSDFDDARLMEKAQKLYAKYGQTDFPNYLIQKKNQLLCENLYETKSTKVYYEMNNNQKLDKRIKCCRFKLQGEQNYQLRFQKYTQFFFNQKQAIVIVVNHKLKQDKHCHLIGSLTQLQQKGQIQLTQMAITYGGQGLLQQNSNNKLFYVNYNHCYTSKYLYIFWPEQWNILELLVCKLLDIEYQSKLVHKIWRFQWYKQHKKTKFQQLKFNISSSSPDLIPRYGCTCYSIKQDLIFIFGGIYSGLEDFKYLPPTISKLQIAGKSLQVSIKNIEKNKTGARLRAKMNYTIDLKKDEKDPKKQNQKIIILSGGYGRDFTNVFNLFSCHSYQFDLAKQQLIKIRHPMRTIKLDKPLSTRKAGKFNLITDDKGQLKFEEKFSNLPKQKFIFQQKPQNVNSSQVGQIIAFMDENFKISEFKTQHRKMYLFGFSRKLKQNIYTNYWSPQFYIHDGSKSYRIQILLQTHKNIEDYKIGQYIFPTQDMIISTAINENKLYILAISPIFTKNLYTLYEGNLNSINQIIEKRKISMINKYTFTDKYNFNLQEKSMYFQDDTIYITGGRCNQNNVREDIILEKKRQKYHLRLRRLKPERQTNLQMLNPYVIKDNKLYSYSIQFDDNLQKWYLKVQATTTNFQQSQITIGQFRLFAVDYTSYQRQMIHPDLIQPRFIKILKYEQFNFQAFSSILQRLGQAITSKIQSIQSEVAELTKFQKQQMLKPWKEAQLICKDGKQFVKKKSNQFKQLQDLYKILKRLHKFLKKQDNLQESDQQLMLQIQATTNMIQKKQIQKSCLQKRDETKQDLYRFIVEDLKNNKLIKYFAIGPLNTVKLDFVRVKFKKQILICSNQKSDQTIFFNLFQGMFNEFTIVKTKPDFITQIEFQDPVTKDIKAQLFNI